MWTHKVCICGLVRGNGGDTIDWEIRANLRMANGEPSEIWRKGTYPRTYSVKPVKHSVPQVISNKQDHNDEVNLKDDYYIKNGCGFVLGKKEFRMIYNNGWWADVL